MVPGCELFNRGPNCGGVDSVEFVGQPGFESCEVFVAWGEKSVVLQQAAQVIDMAPGSCSGEAVMGQWYCAGGDPAEQLQYLDIAFPGQDTFGSVDTAEYFDERLHGGEVGGMVQQYPAEVFAQGAACTLAAAVDLAFATTGPAGEVAGDPCAGQADWSGVGGVAAAGKDAVVSTVGADAVGAHCGVEAAVAQLIPGPVDA